MKRWKNKDHPEAVLEGQMVTGEGRDEDVVDGGAYGEAGKADLGRMNV